MARQNDSAARKQNPNLRERLQTLVPRILKDRDRRIGEQNTKATLIEPTLEALGWDLRDWDEVHREYRGKSVDNPVDYALKIMRTPRLFLEAKGLGENLADRKWIAQVGADYDKIRSGEQALTDAQIDSLSALATKDVGAWLKNHFAGVQMRNHAWLALISLAYNSRWDSTGPTLIGPKLTAAIRSGDMEAAEAEIRFNSQGGVPRSLLRGIRRRRTSEANLFRGVAG